MRDGRFREFPAFAPAFERGSLDTGAYLVLLNLNDRPSEAVLIVDRCLDAAEDKHKQVSNLLSGSQLGELDQLRAAGVHLSDADWDRHMNSSNWRPQLVGCVALLAMNPVERPLDALLDAACRPSWVSPQLLASTALADVPNWDGQVEGAILDRGDAKAAAALLALAGGSRELIELAKEDSDRADEIALGWRVAITDAFDRAGLDRSWLHPEPSDAASEPAPDRLIDEEEARQLAAREIAPRDLVIVGVSQISKTWVASYNCRKYVETGDLRYFETGPGPILISDNGRVMQIPGLAFRDAHSGKSVEELVAEFEFEQRQS